MKNNSILAVITLLVIVTLSNCTSFEKPSKKYVVILSLDGFRWDYTDKFATPNLDFIAKNGVKAKSMIPGFPSTTFANHYTPCHRIIS